MMNGGSFKSPDLDAPIYSLADLAKVTHLPVGTVRMWVERKILTLGKCDVDASGKGSTRQLTLRTLYLAATMAEITRLGVSPSQAAKWAHIIWGLGVDKMIAPQEDMVFVGNPNSERFRLARRRSLNDEIIFSDTSAEEAELSVLVIDVSSVVRKCREALGLPLDIHAGQSSRD
jgi:hypothetical protein